MGRCRPPPPIEPPVEPAIERPLSRSEAFAAWILGHRARTAAGLVLATLLALAGIIDPLSFEPRLRIDPSLNEMLPEDDAARRFYEELLERFGSDDVVVVALRSPTLFSPAGFETLARVSRSIEAIDGVHHVDGLANALRIRPFEGDVEISGYLEPMPASQVEADRLRAALRADPLRAGSFVSRDGAASAILVTFERLSEEEMLARGLDLAVLEAARAAAPGMEIFLAGTPHIKATVARLLTAELTTMVPIVFLLMSALSCAFFRSLRVGLVPIAAVALGLVWTLGAMGWAGHDLNIVTTLIPPLVLALGFAYAAHVVASFQRAGAVGEQARGALAPASRAEGALARVAFPVAFTALTTAAGFLSLGTNDLAVVRGFGFFAAVSTLATFLVALTLVPLLLMRAGAGARTAAGPGAAAGADARTVAAGDAGAIPTNSTTWLDRRLDALVRFDLRHANGILVAAMLLIGGALFGATRIEVNLPVIENFGRETEIRRAYREVDRLFGGANQFYVMLRADEAGAFEDPDLLREIAALQDWLDAQPEIGGTTSVVQYVEVLNEALGSGNAGSPGGSRNPSGRRIPETAKAVAQLLLFGGNEELDVLIDRAHRTATILVRSTATETREFDILARRIDARLAELPAGLTGRTTGNAILLTRAADRISRGQALSLLLASALIGLLLIGYFRSLRLGLLALVPNVIPVVLYFGLLGLTGVTLNNATALMGSIVLGIAVDDTLHLLVEYRRALAKKGDPARALHESVRHVGRAITCTTLAVCLGLLVVGTSELRNQAEFGLLGAATLAIAWLVDLTFTPVLCARWLKSD